MINKHLQEKFKGKSKYKLPFYNKAVQEAPEYLISSFFTCKQIRKAQGLILEVVPSKFAWVYSVKTHHQIWEEYLNH